MTTHRRTIRAALVIALAAAIALLAFRQHDGTPEADAKAIGAARRLAGDATKDAGRATTRGATAAAQPAARARTTARGTPAKGSTEATLAQEFDALEARAEAGDPAAASQLYRDVHRCVTAGRYRQYIDRIERERPRGSGDVGIFEFTSSEQQRIRMQSEMRSFVAASAVRCEGISADRLDALVPAALRAAQLGDLKATDCFLGMGFEQMPGLLDHPEWLTAVRDNTAALFDSAISRGDWVAVELISHAYAGIFADTPGAQVYRPDVAMNYRYKRLERLGATGDFATRLDEQLRDLASGLTAMQIAEGDAWAAAAFDRDFHGTSSDEVSNGANICQIDDD